MSYAGGFLGSYLGAYLGAAETAIVDCYATSTHTVHVSLEDAPLASDAFGDGDALNPRSWAIRFATPGDITVIAVLVVDTKTFVLVTLEPLGSHLDQHTLTTIELRDPANEPYAAMEATFPGAVVTFDPVDAITTEVFRDRDLANPPFQIDRQLGLAGTLQFGADGDYVSEAGRPLVRKLLIRRLGTRRGSIRHLPNYGIGFEVKEPIPSSGRLTDIRKDIESQAMQEPDVSAARARLSVDAAGVCVVQLWATIQGGMTINLRMGLSGGALREI